LCLYILKSFELSCNNEMHASILLEMNQKIK
jgi:hypothetical protein